jgi:hypothetical protein
VTLTAKEGTSLVALLELRLVRNTRFWNTLRKESPEYVKAQGCDLNRFIAVAYSNRDTEKLLEIRRTVERICAEYRFELIVVDASREDSGEWRPYQRIEISGENATIHVGDVITVDGNVVGSAVGRGANVEVQNIAVSESQQPVANDEATTTEAK